MKYSCDSCKVTFHFKKQLHYHLIWSQSCGLFKELGVSDHFEICTSRDSLVSNMKQEVNQRSKKVNENLSIVRLNVTQKTSIILVNCENLVDKAIFIKRSKRSKCGICAPCEISADCLSCTVCNKKRDILVKPVTEGSYNTIQKGFPPVRTCMKRKCIYPIFNVSIFYKLGGHYGYNQTDSCFTYWHN